MNSAEKFLLSLTRSMGPTSDPVLVKTGVDGAPAESRRWYWHKPHYPGEGNRLARRTAKAKRKGGTS